jgi:DeoR/GlpR family transcriptional regulator of sugar metabolism
MVKINKRSDAKARKEKIIELLEQKGALAYQELEAYFGSSHMTVRRDVDKLVEDGKVIKTLGGIQKANAPDDFYESRLSSRMAEKKEEKFAIASLALEQIETGDIIYLDGSTTCITLAKLIAAKIEGLTVVTNSMYIYWHLARGKMRNTIITLGGVHEPDSCCLVGEDTEESVKKYFINKSFISTKGFVPGEGTYESSVSLFKIKQGIANQSLKLFLLIDSSKFGKRALSKVLDSDRINMVITDDNISDEHVKQMEESQNNYKVACVENINNNILSEI